MTLNPFTPVARRPPVCPYCGSIENNNRTCFWCGNIITDETESGETTMTLEIKFSGLTPEQALRLIKAASGSNAEAEIAEPLPAAPAVPIAPSAPAAPVIPTAPPTAVKQYTADELAVAARPLCETPEMREQLLNLLHSFSYTDAAGDTKTVQSIRDMPPELYPQLANGIRQLGGRI